MRGKGLSLPVELGPEFIHGRPGSTWKLIREAGLTAYDVSGDHWQRRGTRLRPADVSKEMHEVFRRIGRIRGPDRSFAEALRLVRRKLSAPAIKMARAFVEGFDAADLERVSTHSIAEEQEGLGDVEHQPQFRLLEGYGALATYLRRAATLAGAEVRLGWPVRVIRWERGGVQVEGPRGVLRAKAAVVTLPVGVLQDRDGKSAVRFDPELKDKRTAAAQLGSGPIVKIVLRFDEAIWERTGLAKRAKGAEHFEDFGFLHDADAPIPTWWSTLPLRAPVLTGWAGGGKARQLSGLPREKLARLAVRGLSDLTGVPERQLRASLVSSHWHDWPSDPWSRGAYSYILVGGRGARAALGRSVDGVLFFAGEAADDSDQASTVAGALASGEKAGRDLLRRLRRK